MLVLVLAGDDDAGDNAASDDGDGDGDDDVFVLWLKRRG